MVNKESTLKSELLSQPQNERMEGNLKSGKFKAEEKLFKEIKTIQKWEGGFITLKEKEIETLMGGWIRWRMM